MDESRHYDRSAEQRGKRNPPARWLAYSLQDREEAMSHEWLDAALMFLTADRPSIIASWAALGLKVFNGDDHDLERFIHFCFYLLSVARIQLKVDGNDKRESE